MTLATMHTSVFGGSNISKRRWMDRLGLALAMGLAMALFVAAPAAADDCPDGDGDGFVVCDGECTVPAGKECGDCNDGDPNINPDATERCDDAIDSNCDGHPNDPYPNLGEDCAHCTGPDCPTSYCLSTGPNVDCDTYTGALCLSASLADDGRGVVCGDDGLSEDCRLPTVPPDAPIADFEVEGLGSGNPGNYSEPTCNDGQDNDCDDDTGAGTGTDFEDSGCWAPELCNGLDDDGDGSVDEDFPLSSPGSVGSLCSVGVGSCEVTSTFSCNPDGLDASCGATPGTPENEGTTFGISCADGEDNDCDTLTDLDDPDCAGFGDPELCGDGVDNDGDGLIDEGFPQIGIECAVGVGACTSIGTLVCDGAGTGVECGAVAGAPPEPTEASCTDFLDNDCDGLTDAADPDCAATYADLGVTCALPFARGKPGRDCTGKHTITFGSTAGGVTFKADLLALGSDGSLLDIIENVGFDEAHLASRTDPDDFRVDTKTSANGIRHTVFAPMPILRVQGTDGVVEDVAYCSIMPWLEVSSPDGQTISLSETSMLEVGGLLPLVDVDTLGFLLDGVDILAAAGIDPATDFPTNGTALCSAPGDCVVSIEAGCGDGSFVDVEISNLRVEGFDTDMVGTHIDAIGWDQVNTYSFSVSGLPAGGHIFYVTGDELPLPPTLSDECLIDDLADAGTASAFGITIDSPTSQEIVASAPVFVEGTACGGNEITALSIQGTDLDVALPPQVCTAGNGTTTADECVIDFNEPIDETDLQLAATGGAPGGTFHAGSNRIVADASDDDGNRTFNTDVIFGLGQLQAPGAPFTSGVGLPPEEAFRQAGRGTGRALATEILEMQERMADEIDPAFVIGLEESAVQDFFNEKCEDAIEQFSAQAEANLNNTTFATVTFNPTCSCEVTAPIVLEDVDFIASTEDPTCAVDFRTDEIGVRINLPDIRIQVGAHKSCTRRGLFGECLARTRIDMTAISQISDIAFGFTITEDQIETMTEPLEETRVLTWIVEDHDGTDLFLGGNECVGGTQAGESCIADSQCSGGGVCNCARDPNDAAQCAKDTGNPAYNPVTQQNSGISCWGASVCNALVGTFAFLVEVFTFGFVDAYELFLIIEFDVDFEEDFLAEVDGAEPDPLELDAVEIDEDKVASFDQGAFTPGDIDVEIENGGLKIEFPATFMSLDTDPMGEETPGAVLTPASGPTIAMLVNAGDEISVGIADDVFNQLFASMKEAGTIQAFCTDGDGLTVDNLLPFDDPGIPDDGCDSLGAADGEVTVGDATVQGICHAVRGADCSLLTGSTQGLTNAKVGACTGFSDLDCTPLNFGAKLVCNAVPARDISSDDSLLLCARQDLEPRLLFQDDDASDNTVNTELLLNDTNVVFAIDKANDGYTGELEALQGCFGEEGDAAPDCLLYAVCLDLTLQTTMGIDNSSCEVLETGFVFSLNQVIASGIDPGVMCSAATTTDDELITGEGIESIVIDTVADAAEAFTPPFCAEGLTLGGVLDFTSPDAKMFAITTDEATEGFADFIFLTGSLGPPSP